ncbi:uncharacterized protein PWA37_004689 [Arxiozyma heterogenica]|uniref:Uncharacterized protein n=1 Tax=Arxiozyma heterogenica TaxID=278026 RepID=A0AAN8A9D3_9SACH|nr:hypothetical protein RI543_000969 [Kazachstania heterogenica]
MNSKTALILAAAAATASAVTPTQEKQLDIIFADVGANLNQYIGLVSDPSSGITFNNLPAGLMDIGEKVALNPSDTSYTSDYDKVNMAGVSAFVTKLSWYSSRLAPKLDAAGVPIGGETTTTSTSSTAKTTSTTAATTSTSSSSSEAKTTSTSAAASSSSSSEAKTTSTSAATSSSAHKTTATTAKATTQAISQIGDGQIQATAVVSQQTANGAAKAVAGLGAGAFAAAALLL